MKLSIFSLNTEILVEILRLESWNWWEYFSEFTPTQSPKHIYVKRTLKRVNDKQIDS